MGNQVPGHQVMLWGKASHALLILVCAVAVIVLTSIIEALWFGQFLLNVLA